MLRRRAGEKKETRSEAFLVNVPRMRSPRLQEPCHVAAMVKDGLLISPCASGSASAAGRSFVH